MSVHIVIDGTPYSGWTKATVKRDIKSMSGSFSLSIGFEGANFVQQAIGTRVIKKGAECAVYIKGQLAVTGTIEKRRSKGTKKSYVLSIEGRSKTKKAIKSSPKGKSIQFNDMNRTDIVKKIAKDLDINVIDNSGSTGGKVIRHIMSDGATAAQEIYNIAREGGLQVSDDVNGNLVILNPDGDGEGDDIILGVNIEEWDANLSDEDEKHEYKAVGHSVQTDEKYGKEAMDIASTAIDSVLSSKEIRRIRVDSDVDLDTLKKRAILEARRSKANNNEVVVKTGHIVQSSGELWAPNKKHFVDIFVDNISNTMLLKSVEWNFDKENGSASLTFTIDKGYSNSGGKGAKGKKGGKLGSNAPDAATGEDWESNEVYSENDA